MVNRVFSGFDQSYQIRLTIMFPPERRIQHQLLGRPKIKNRRADLHRHLQRALREHGFPSARVSGHQRLTGYFLTGRAKATILLPFVAPSFSPPHAIATY